VVPKVAATSAIASTAHRHGVVTIANVSRVLPKVVGMNASALTAGQNADDLSASASKVRATVNLIASDLPVRPKIFASMAPVVRSIRD
jgi:hypothetical protein